MSVCACTTVRPLAWAAAQSTQHSGFSNQRQPTPTPTPQGGPRVHTRPLSDARCSLPWSSHLVLTWQLRQQGRRAADDDGGAT